MLLESGDLIPVKKAAIDIPWTRRKSQILNFLHRGPVDFSTYVYDTNVGDIAPLSTYFNPYQWTVDDLNFKFGMKPVSTGPRDTVMRTSPANLSEGEDLKSRSLQPRLFIYPLEKEEISPDATLQDSRCQNLLNGVDFSGTWDLPVSSGSGSTFSGLEFKSRVVKPRAIRANSVPNEKQPISPDSPVRIIWPTDFGSEIRPWTTSPTESLEPIGPPKRRKIMTSTSGNFGAWGSIGRTASGEGKGHDNWPTMEELKERVRENGNPFAQTSLKFSLFDEDTTWSPWSFQTTSKLSGSDPLTLASGEDDGLVSSLRKIAAQSDVFIS